jgi:hypothetical protein
MKASNVKPIYIQQMRDELQLSDTKPSNTKQIQNPSTTLTSTASARTLTSSTSRYQSPARIRRDLQATTAATDHSTSSSQFVVNDADSSLLQIIFENPPVQVPSFSSERDLQRNFDNILTNLSKMDDWQTRIQALLNLQSLVLEKHEPLAQLLRGAQELVSTEYYQLSQGFSMIVYLIVNVDQ